MGLLPAASSLGMARYTDAPAYYFDLSFGKPILPGIKWTGMLGFYSRQIISDRHGQNDAFLFGTGAELYTRSLRLQ